MAATTPSRLISRLTTKSQTVLPQAVREHLGVGPGDDLAYELIAGGAVIRRAEAAYTPLQVYQLLRDAVQRGASMVTMLGGQVRFLRADGSAAAGAGEAEEYPPGMCAQVLAAAGLELAGDSASPVAGRMTCRIADPDHPAFEVDLEALPTLAGPFLTIQLPVTTLPPPPVGSGDYPAAVTAWARARVQARAPGLILITGRCGSGRTMGMHELMLAATDENDKVMWLSTEPMPFALEDYRAQVVFAHHRFIQQQGIAVGISSACRTGTDLVVVDELRDGAGARAALQASHSRLVIATMHATAESSLRRLIALALSRPDGDADWRRAQTIQELCANPLVVVHQRLVPLLCPDCNLHPLEAQKRSLLTAEEWQMVCDLKGSGLGDMTEMRMKSAAGCAQCNGRGYKDRIRVMDTMVVPDPSWMIPLLENNEDVWSAATARNMVHRAVDDVLPLIGNGMVDFRGALHEGFDLRAMLTEAAQARQKGG